MRIEFRRDGPWELPEGWVWARLGPLGQWLGGGTPAKSNAAFWTNGTVPWVSPKDMKVDIIEETEDLITVDAVTNSATKLVPKGSVLMVVRSGILNHTFPVAVAARDVTLNQDMRAMIPHKGIDSRYIAFLLRRLQSHVLDECSKDGTTVASVEPSKLEQVWVPIAPLAEQQRIVARIDELFTEIADGQAALARARTDLDTWRRALLKAAVTGELTRDWREQNGSNETGHDVLDRVAEARRAYTPKRLRARLLEEENIIIQDLPALPQGWTWARLGNIGEIVGGVTVDKKRKPDSPTEVPYLRVANVQRGYLALDEMKSIVVDLSVANSLILQWGDILLNEGGDRDKIGRGWVWEDQIEGCIHQNHVFRVRLYDRAINPFFVSHYANELGRRFFIENGRQTTNLASINLTKISQLPVPVGPVAEMREAMRILDELLLAVEDVEKQFKVAAVESAARQSILKAAFEGRLVEGDPSDEPAEHLLARLSAENPTKAAPRRGRPAKLKEAAE